MSMEQTVRCPQCGTLTRSDVIRIGGVCRGCLVSVVTSEPAASVAPPAVARRHPPVPVEVTRVDPSLRLGKFIPTCKLGSGSSGEVWKAWDSVLGRWVALKVFPVEDSEESARFTREAETAATLSHPHIAAIYEAGEDKGRHFLAMQFVDGVTLQKHPRRDRKALVRILRDAARAVAAAHDQGIVHRDLKPANIAVARRSEDPSHPHVYVLDFGLARRIEGADRLTASGIVVGTPAYMAPEQARGELVDGRADVYALGATLYELLAKRPPFRGPNVYEVLRKVQESEPRSPRAYDSKIPRDLELVVLKALEKDPNRRYASADEMADDLDRYLEGDPVLAQPPSFFYRLRMKLAKRKAVVGTAVASLALAAALGWWLLIGSADARYHRLVAAANKLWSSVRDAVAGGDPDDIRKKSRAAREHFEQAIQVREEPGDQVMRGKCLQLEGRGEEALKALERAYELNPKNAEARVELAKAILLKYHASRGLATWSTFERRAEGEVRIRVRDLPPETAEERKWRVRVEKLLGEGEVSPEQERLLQGLLSMGKAEYAPAAAALADYAKEARWDVQALRLEGICRYYAAEDFERAIAVFDRLLIRFPGAADFKWRGLAKRAKGLADEAITDFTKALELNPKDAWAYANRGLAKYFKGVYDEAIDDYTKAIDLDSKNVPAYANRGNAKHALGLYEEAIADYAKAIELDPNSAAAYFKRGTTKHAQGNHDEAIADYTKAIELDPKFAEAYSNRGLLRCDVQHRYDEAIADHTKAIELDSKDAGAYSNRGGAKAAQGLHDEAIADCMKALELDPDHVMAHYNRGVARKGKGLHEEALADFTKAIELDPKFAEAYCSRGMLKYGVMSLHDDAIADFTKAIELNPKLLVAYFYRGNARHTQGRHDDAIADYTKAIELDPKDPELYFNRGIALTSKGRIEEAIADCRKALHVAPSDWPYRTRVEQRIAELETAASQNPQLKTVVELFEKSNRLHGEGKYAEAIEGFRKIAEEFPKTQAGLASAFNVACGYALLGKKSEALDWLEKAVEMGWKNVDSLKKDTDLDSLRGEERYKKLVDRLERK
jgi:tetratricopeptide (TPR) repeat protein/predicted Ser/Thr protein kinase